MSEYDNEDFIYGFAKAAEANGVPQDMALRMLAAAEVVDGMDKDAGLRELYEKWMTLGGMDKGPDESRLAAFMLGPKAWKSHDEYQLKKWRDAQPTALDRRASQVGEHNKALKAMGAPAHYQHMTEHVDGSAQFKPAPALVPPSRGANVIRRSWNRGYAKPNPAAQVAAPKPAPRPWQRPVYVPPRRLGAGEKYTQREINAHRIAELNRYYDLAGAPSHIGVRDRWAGQAGPGDPIAKPLPDVAGPKAPIGYRPISPTNSRKSF